MPEAVDEEAPASAFAVLARNPTYRWFFAGQGASLIGTWSQAAAVRWIVFEVSKSERVVGFVDAAETLPGLVVGLAAGAAADRVGPRPMLLAMLVGQACFAFTLAAMVGGEGVQVWRIALVLSLSQVFVTFEEPARQVLQRRLVGRSSLGHAIALETGLFNASRVLGPALAGLCLSLVGWSAPFALNGVSFLAALLILALIRVPPGADAPDPEAQADGGMLSGLKHVWHDRRTLRTFALLGFFGAAGMGYTSLVPSYARGTLHAAEGGYSALQVGGGIGSTLGAVVVAWLANWRRRDLLIPGGMAVAGIALAAAGLLPGRMGGDRAALAVATACFFANGLGTIVVFASAQTLIQAAAPDAIRGRVVGLWMIVFSGSFPVGSLAAGMLARPVGVIPVMVGSAVLCVATAALVLMTGALAPRPSDPADA